MNGVANPRNAFGTRLVAVLRLGLIAGYALGGSSGCTSSTARNGAGPDAAAGMGGEAPSARGGSGGLGGASGTGGTSGTADVAPAAGGDSGSGATSSAATGGVQTSGGAGMAGAGGGATGAGGLSGNGGSATTGGATTAGSGGKMTGGASGSGGAASGGSTTKPSTGGAAGGGATSGGAAGGGAPGTGGAAGTGGATADGGTSPGDPCGPANPATVPLPTIGAGTFDVKTYGATGDGATDDTKALQAALTAASSAGGGTVTVPAGTFLSGPLTVGSGTRLDLATGAILRMLPMARYPGATAFLTASNAHDIALTGNGTIDGQGQDWWTAFAGDSTLARPQEMVWSNSTRVLISGVRLQNPPEEHIWVKGDKDVTITGITISTLAVSGQSPPKNTDGIDLSGDGFFLCNNHIECGDDNVAMSGTNIYVGYSTFGVGHGCSIGSITKNGVDHLTVDHLTMNGTTSGIRMKSARDRGGLVQNLTYTNVTMTNVQNPIYITSYYPSLPSDPTADAAQAITATTPAWQNITLQNVTATGSSNGGILWGLPEAKIANVIFDNVRIQATTGMEVFHATGVSFRNGSAVTPKSGAAVTTYDADVTGVAVTPY